MLCPAWAFTDPDLSGSTISKIHFERDSSILIYLRAATKLVLQKHGLDNWGVGYIVNLV